MQKVEQVAPVKLAYTYEESVQVVGVSIATLKRAVASGDLACCKVGTRVLFTEQQLMDWLKSKEFRLKRKN